MQYLLLAERGLQPTLETPSMVLFYFHSKLQKDIEARQQAALAEAAKRRRK